MRKLVMALLSFALLASVLCVSETFSLNAYVLTLKLEDADGDPLSGAWVRVTTKYGVEDLRSVYGTTDESGLVSFTLQSVESSAQVRVYWKSVDVAYQVVSLQNTTSPVVIRCSVSDLKVLVLDGDKNPLQGAYVRLYWKTDIPWTLEGKTSKNGAAVFSQMPCYDKYEVSVQWKNRQVYQGLCSLNASHGTYVAKCGVYKLAVNVKDKGGRPVSQAKVTVERDDGVEESKNTNASGYVIFGQLARGNYSVQASYERYSAGAAVSLSRSTDIQLVLDAAILRSFSLFVHVVWSDGVPADEASVSVKDFGGTVVAEGKANASGVFVAEILEGNYTIQVSVDEFDESRNVTLAADTVVEFICDFSLRRSEVVVNVLDEKGSPASGAEVEVYTGDKLLLRETTEEGTVSFNLKSGTYRIVAEYKGEEKESVVEVRRDVALTFEFSKNIDSMLMLYMLTIMAVILLSVLLYVARKRRRRRDPFRDLERELSRMRRIER